MRKARTNFDKSMWTPEEVEKLRRLAAEHPARQVAEMLGRPFPSVRGKMQREGIAAVSGKDWRPWTTEEEDFLWENCETMFAAEMGQHLNRSEQSVKKKCWAIGAPLQKKLYSDEDVRLCRELFAAGVSREDISEKLEVPYQRVVQWLLGRARNNVQ